MGLLLRPAEAARRLGRTRAFIEGLIRLGLPTRRFQPAGIRYIDSDELDAFIAEKTGPLPPRLDVERQTKRTRAQECEALGIPVDHTFA